MDAVDDKVIAGIVGLLSGVLGSFLAPWANWGVEKRRLRFLRKKDLVESWRTALSQIIRQEELVEPGELVWILTQSPEFLSLRPNLSDYTKKLIEAEKFTHDELFESIFADIANIEASWKLI